MTLPAVFSFFAQLDPELHVQDIATMPGLIWFFGVLVWFFAAMGRRQGKVQKWKWILAYVLVLLSVYAAWAGWGSDADRHQGFGPYILDEFGVRAQYNSKKLVATVYGSFIGPILTVLLLWYFDRR